MSLKWQAILTVLVVVGVTIGAGLLVHQSKEVTNMFYGALSVVGAVVLASPLMSDLCTSSWFQKLTKRG